MRGCQRGAVRVETEITCICLTVHSDGMISTKLNDLSCSPSLACFVKPQSSQNVQRWTCWTQTAPSGMSVICLPLCQDGIWTRSHTSITKNICQLSLRTPGRRGMWEQYCEETVTNIQHVFPYSSGVLQVPQRDPANVWRPEQQQVTLERAGWGVQCQDEGNRGWEEETWRRRGQER